MPLKWGRLVSQRETKIPCQQGEGPLDWPDIHCPLHLATLTSHLSRTLSSAESHSLTELLSGSGICYQKHPGVVRFSVGEVQFKLRPNVELFGSFSQEVPE